MSSLLRLSCLLINVLLVEQENGLELVKHLDPGKLIERILGQCDFVEFSTLLLQLLVLISDNLALLFELISE